MAEGEIEGAARLTAPVSPFRISKHCALIELSTLHWNDRGIFIQAFGAYVAGTAQRTLLKSSPGYLILFTASANVSRPNLLTMSFAP